MTRLDPPQNLVVLGADTPVGRALLSISDQESPRQVIGLPSQSIPDAAVLASAFASARAVVDIADATGASPETDIRNTVTEATRSVVAAAEAAGVDHLVFVSSAGLGRASESEHFTARVAAERVVEQSAVQHTIVRTTQLFESVRDLSRSRSGSGLEHARPLIQPIAAWDVADAVAGIAKGGPRSDIVALAGPDRFRLDELVERDQLVHFHREAWASRATAPARSSDPLDGDSLLPGGRAEITGTRFADWVAQSDTSSGMGRLPAPTPRSVPTGRGPTSPAEGTS